MSDQGPDQQPDQEPARSGAESAATASAQPAQAPSARPSPAGPAPTPSPLPRWWNERRVMAVWGGVLAGLGFGIAIALLMHVIQQTSTIGSGFGLGGSIFAVITLGGLLFGLGLGMAFAALIPDQAAESADRATPTDQPGSEPASAGS